MKDEGKMLWLYVKNWGECNCRFLYSMAIIDCG